jgi:DnaK suppressor protein
MVRTKSTRKPSVTEEVVGQPPRQQSIKPKWRKHFCRLIELRDYLNRLRRDLSHDVLEEKPTFSTHMADAGSDSFDRDFALGLLSHEQNAVYEIEAALSRIRDGTYGKCELTGKPIPARRLEAIPWTRFTAETEKTLERCGGFQRARLGPRDTLRGREPNVGPEPEI